LRDYKVTTQFARSIIAIVLAAYSVANADEPATEHKERRGQAEIARLETKIANANSESERQLAQEQIGEIRAALDNNHQSSVPSYVDLIEVPFLLANALDHPVGKGKKPASNLEPATAPRDLSRLDPVSSTYWKRPPSIATADLGAGFDRPEAPAYEGLWNYAGPKKSGWNGGCVLESGGVRLKVKFAEIHSEPFTSRIFHALGYNVDPTDYSPGLKFKYDRRFFQEFNSRRPMIMRAGMFFIPLYRLDLQARHDPFQAIDHANLKSGVSLSGSELKAALVGTSKRKRTERIPEAFNSEIENQIDYLVTIPANVQVEAPHTHNIGPWDFGGRGHENLRELRGAGLLAAWLGWWDSRFENTRLRIVKTPDGPTLKHFWSDLGGGLGRAGGAFSHSCENTNDFGWAFTRSTLSNGKLRFEITGYEPVEETPAFAEMTIDDARWMARLIAQLTEQQIVDGLVASGFDPAEVHIYTEKLLSRRDKMIRDLQLTNEFVLLRPGPPRGTMPPAPPRLLSKSR
jgi:hypothetical protein